MLTLLLTACAAPPRDPVEVMLDRDTEPSRRLQALAALADDPRSDEAMTGLVWDDRQPTALRLAAMDRLIAQDEASFRQDTGRRLHRVERWEFLAPLCERIAAEGWDELTPALIRSWARQSRQYDDASRPERKAVEAVHPGVAVDRMLWRTLESEPLPVGAAAWTILYRTTDRQAMADDLMRQPSASPLLIDLQAGWSDLHILPRNREQVIWLLWLRGHEEGLWWRRATDYVATLPPEARQDLALRHVPLLVMAADERTDRVRSRDELLQRVNRTWHGPAGQTYDRTDEETATRPRISEALESHRDRLSWGDLLTLAAIVAQIHEAPTRRELFAQADADLLDTTTEYGGVFAPRQREFGPVGFPPALTGNDRAFYAPPELIEAMYTALAHYHFHAAGHDSRAFAGPGGGDLAFADRFGAACLVFTFIDRDTLNVDYYHEGDVVIDLGCIARPK